MVLSKEDNQAKETSEVDKTLMTKSKINEQTIAISFLVLVAALVGAYYLAITLIPTPKIGIIDLQTQVDGALVNAMSRELEYARTANDIKGVVIVINSPGGGAAAGHDIYYQVRRLRDEKPVIASMDSLAASAAYQIGVGATEIYAKPASLVGNVGVISGQPSPEILNERVITTGPFKSTGGSATSWMQKLDMLYADFRDSVVVERTGAPNPLKLTPAQVATGELWIGVEAKEYGLIDELGSVLDAIDRAAELAGVKNFEVVNVREEYLTNLQETGTVAEYEAALELYEALASQPEFDLTAQQEDWPTFYQIYIPLE
jgi:protease-4